jgi:hypothetical protein
VNLGRKEDGEMPRKLSEAEWKAVAWVVFKTGAISKMNKLAFYQELRDRNVLPEEATFFLLEWMAVQRYEYAVERDPEAMKYLRAMGAIQSKHRNNDGWPDGRGPKRYQALSRKYEKRRNQFIVDALRKIDEPGMAELFLTDPKRFKEMSRAGHEYFHRDFDFDFSVEGLRKRGFPLKRTRKAA